MAERVPEVFLSGGHQFPEGPIVDKDGTLYICELARGTVTKITTDGESTVLAEMAGSPNGIAFGPDRAIYVCNGGGRWVPRGSTDCSEGPGDHPGLLQRLELDGSYITLISEIDGVPLNAPNDIVFDPEGNFYFTDPIWQVTQGNVEPGTICFSTLDGQAKRLHTGMAYPNGIALSPDAKTLIVAETYTAKLLAFAITAPGEIGKPREFATLRDGAWPDGLCVDAEGRVITTGHGVAALQVFPPDGGAQEDEIPMEEPYATNICFGGEGFRQIYATHSGSGRIVSVEWKTPGLVLFPDR